MRTYTQKYVMYHAHMVKPKFTKSLKSQQADLVPHVKAKSLILCKFTHSVSPHVHRIGINGEPQLSQSWVFIVVKVGVRVVV